MFQNKWARKQRPVLIGAAAPVTGRLFPLREVNDVNFSHGYLGDGVAIEPASDCVVAPFDGIISHIAEAKHALLLKHASGLQLLIHIGIDTVDLRGEGFDMLVNVNDRVRLGQPLVQFDLTLIRKAGFSTCAIFIVIGGGQLVASIECNYRDVYIGEPDAFRIMLKQIT
ncbi:PTS system glucose-specific IIA component [Paenibacillus endophyticus]|uniref:PTS system glucose-specific IIA component n=1 Tax=Paenibacillus endophyticus TaxID=1294268 RepID=A0A7W5C6I2_9BACL|nr:PTS glucose transporter subunit IIA [Paenibacillus endophyticus]MBB3151024.1 PTS system glucose-specific IIA component [Paenibacillus endophyticus]